MLLAGRQGQDETALALGIDGLAAQPARHLPDIFLLATEQPDIGTAELQADTERLAFADHDIRAHLARRDDRAQRHGFGDHRDQQRLVRLCLFGKRGHIGDAAENVGILDDNAAGLVVDLVEQALAIGRGVEHRRLIGQLIAGEFCHGFGYRHIMRMQARREDCLAALGNPARHGDRFPAGGRAVVHRGIGDIDAEQARDLGLEFEQCLQRALRDLRLIGRVGGEKLAALDDMIDARGHMMAVGTGPEEEGHVAGGVVLFRQCLHMRFHRHLAGVHRQALDRAGQARFLRHVDEQIVDRLRADLGQHRLPVFWGQREISHILSFTLAPPFERRVWGGSVPPVAARAMLTHRHHPFGPLLFRGGEIGHKPSTKAL